MRRIYHGWNLVAYLVAGQALLVGATQTAFGLYVLPVSHEFGLSRADTNMAIILMNLGSAVSAPLIGWLADRLPARPMILTGAVAVGLSFTTLGLSHSVLLSAIVLLALIAADGAALRPVAVLIVRWFEARRGRALTFGAMGLSLAGILVAPVVGFLIGNFGWRASVLTSGAAAATILILPALFLRFRPRPEELAREMNPETPAALAIATDRPTPLRFAALLRMPQFWCIGIAIAIPMSVSQAVAISLAPIAVESGIPITLAATFASAAGIMAITGKVGLALIADKANQMLLLVVAFCIGAVENLLLFSVATHASYPVLLGCAVLQGLSSGMLMPLFTVTLARRFGAASFGTVFGLMAPIIAVLNALFARFAGEVFDRTGDYRFAFATFVGLEIFAAVLMFSANRFRTPAVIAADLAAAQARA